MNLSSIKTTSAYLAVLLFLAPVASAASTGPELRHEIASIAAAAHGHVGVACSIEGEVGACGYHEHERFPMQSVYKLPIAMAMLDAIDKKDFKLDQQVRFLPQDQIAPDQHSPLRAAHPQANVDVPVRELLRLAVSESDGTASDILMRVLGGAGKVDAYVHGLVIDGLKIADTEKVIGRDVMAQYRNYAEPAAMVLLLNRLALHSPLSAENTKLLLRWMSDSPTGPHRIKGLLPAGTPVAHKTGTSGVSGGLARATNDVGIITLANGRHLTMAIFVSDSRASEAVRELVIAKIAKLLWDTAR